MSRTTPEYHELYKEYIKEVFKRGDDFNEQRYNELHDKVKQWLKEHPPLRTRKQPFLS